MWRLSEAKVNGGNSGGGGGVGGGGEIGQHHQSLLLDNIQVIPCSSSVSSYDGNVNQD